MKIKKAILEKTIQDSIDSLKRDDWNLSEGFAIHIENGIEVQIHVTRDQDDLCREILEEYELADYD